MSQKTFARVSMAVALALIVSACARVSDQKAGEEYQTGAVSEEIFSAEPDDTEVEAVQGACDPPKVICHCYCDGIARCVGAGFCAKCCRGEILACAHPCQ